MAALSAAAKNAMLDDYLTGTWYLSAYIGDPLGAGSEVSTSGTAYARQACTIPPRTRSSTSCSRTP